MVAVKSVEVSFVLDAELVYTVLEALESLIGEDPDWDKAYEEITKAVEA